MKFGQHFFIFKEYSIKRDLRHSKCWFWHILIILLLHIQYNYLASEISFWIPDFSRTAFYEITLVRLFVCPSVCLSVCPSVPPSLSFLKIGLLVFSDIVHDDSWPWYLLTDKARFLKKVLRLEFGPNGSKLGQN